MNKAIKEQFDAYPEHVKSRLLALRELIFTVAAELALGEVEESLKWGEPSYSVKTGTPLRIDWKTKFPERYCLFFHCQTKLADTFRELYGDAIELQGNRAIMLPLSKPLPDAMIRHCITLALTYQQRKHLPLLGA
ncbi:DUF1801 domain-containing protein [Pseudoalteromonas sp. DL2-H2.2]|uniref:DUF1801 domain-containing protein n=1 Tax=Pseudoalteromonas sp. DL2-H2.2 TaxID=2908889 RepID=UPI001F165229|nr:DUF1801 domain-containing protein [Pseudoalteromonas sp. DL2-H2.2]MCF2907141.1 DUF1801 domain-containing protein [Pseudoalteromonas sp. DL2-H2.2]